LNSCRTLPGQEAVGSASRASGKAVDRLAVLDGEQAGEVGGSRGYPRAARPAGQGQRYDIETVVEIFAELPLRHGGVEIAMRR
jgi:hypothetical protein